ncbi:MAG: GNAT family N-acetyltransferase [Deltaproteobacteria bacterium]|nr:GNAT family N-acetyltransferase [Deltaproteobacteria bacterium]
MLTIRPAEPRDAALLLQLVRELAEYEKLAHEVEATAEDFLRDGFGPRPRFEAAVAEWDGTPAGFALWFYNYSTFAGRHGLYLEDLFVRPPFRGKGIGKALLVHLAGLAAAQGCARYQWQVLDWNTPSIRFYEALGARKFPEWLTMRVAGPDIARLAGQQPAPPRVP